MNILSVITRTTKSDPNPEPTRLLHIYMRYIYSLVTATITNIISRFLVSTHLERVAHYRKLSEARDYTFEVPSLPCKSVRTLKQLVLLL